MDDRLLESLEYNCGPLIMEPLRDPGVIEIMLNPDGAVWIERYAQDQERIGELPLAQGKLILSLVASALNVTVDARHPVVEGSFPLDGSRFEGAFPPVVGPGASFSLRKKASRIITLAEYLEQGVIKPEAVPLIRSAIADRKNIVVVGGTSSGKTTFVNAIIHELDDLCPHDRLLILEDTAELQSCAPNAVFFLTSELAGIGMRQLAKVAMRYAPKRILVGEVRDAAALELLKLWSALRNWLKRPASVRSGSLSAGPWILSFIWRRRATIRAALPPSLLSTLTVKARAVTKRRSSIPPEGEPCLARLFF